MQDFIIDLHSHAQMKAYAHSFKKRGHNYINSSNWKHKNSAWRSDWPSAEDLDKNVNGSLGLTQFTQADIMTCMQGNVGLIFSSLYPVECAFMRPLGLKGRVVDKLINRIVGFGKPRIDFIQKIKDYFPDLVNEYQFNLAQHGKIKQILGKNYRYQFVKDFPELEQLLLEQDNEVRTLAVINSIEGGHCFGTGIKPYRLPERMDLILDRIQEVKSWEYPPFFLTFAHHFYNELCGHAKSLGIVGLLSSQKKGMDEGFTPEGETVLHHLLDESNGKRILIDIKHMSLTARKQYYEILEQNYAFSIPIIVSHGCVTGAKNKINGAVIPTEIEGTTQNRFNNSDINFFDFELVKIKQSGGLFGIQLDERRISGKSTLNGIKGTHSKELLLRSSKLVWNQIQHIAEVLDQAGLFAWDIQCIGSDFDGIVDPIDGFFSAAHFPNLSKFLEIHAEHYVRMEMSERIKNKMNHISGKEIINRLMQTNAYEFLRKNF